MDSLEMIQNFNSEEFIIKNFQGKYLKYFLPLIDGQYYVANNGNDRSFVEYIHQFVNSTNINKPYNFLGNFMKEHLFSNYFEDSFLPPHSVTGSSILSTRGMFTKRFFGYFSGNYKMYIHKQYERVHYFNSLNLNKDDMISFLIKDNYNTGYDYDKEKYIKRFVEDFFNLDNSFKENIINLYNSGIREPIDKFMSYKSVMRFYQRNELEDMLAWIKLFFKNKFFFYSDKLAEFKDKLNKENYYFISGYDTHAVFVCKYNNMIIIGNVGAGGDTNTIDGLNRAINYYEYKLEYMIILLFYCDFISDKLYNILINIMNENTTLESLTLPENQIFSQITKIRILNYDVLMDRNYFYLKAQDKGTCTWHSVFMADIFFNYYLNQQPIDLDQNYQAKQNFFLNILQNPKFKTFNKDNLNLQIIQKINDNDLDESIRDFYNLENEMFDILRFYYKARARNSHYNNPINNTSRVLDLIRNNIKLNDLDENQNLIDNRYFESTDASYMISKVKDDVPENSSLIVYSMILSQDGINYEDLSDVIDEYFNKKQYLNNSNSLNNPNNYPNIIKNCRTLITKANTTYEKNKLMIIFCYEIFKKIESGQLHTSNRIFNYRFKKSYEAFYNQGNNMKNFNDFIKINYPYIEMNENSIDAVYNIMKISYFLFQVKDIRKDEDEDSYYSENYDFGNLFNLISNDDYDNLKQIYDGLITNYIAVMNLLPAFKSYFNEFRPTDDNSFIFIEELPTEVLSPSGSYTRDLSRLKNIVKDLLKINPIFFFNSDIIEYFFIGMICAINFKFGANLNNESGPLKTKEYAKPIFKSFTNPTIIPSRYNDEISDMFSPYDDILRKRCTKRLPLKYFRLEEDNYKYNNYIYGILKECKKVNREFYNDNINKSSLLAYSNYFVDTKNIEGSHNFNLDYISDSIIGTFKIDKNIQPGPTENNMIFFNLLNKYSIDLILPESKINEIDEDLRAGDKYPYFKKKEQDIVEYLKKFPLEGISFDNDRIKYYADNIHQIKNLYKYLFFQIDKSNETIFLLNNVKFTGSIIPYDNFISSIGLNNEKLKQKLIYCVDVIRTRNIDRNDDLYKVGKIYFIRDEEKLYFNYYKTLFKLVNNELYVNNNLISTDSIFEKHIYNYHNIFISGNKLIILCNLDVETKYPICKIRSFGEAKAKRSKFIDISDFYIELDFNETFTTITNVDQINYNDIKYCIELASFFNDHYLMKIFFDVIKNFPKFYQDEDFKMTTDKDFKIGSIFVNSFWDILGTSSFNDLGESKIKFDISQLVDSESDYDEGEVKSQNVNQSRINLKIKNPIIQVNINNIRYTILAEFKEVLEKGLDITNVSYNGNINSIEESDKKLIMKYLQNTNKFSFNSKKCNDSNNFFSNIEQFKEDTEQNLTVLKNKIFMNHYIGILKNLHYINIITTNIDDYVNYIQYRQIDLFFKRCQQTYQDCNNTEAAENCINDILKYFLEIDTENKTLTDILFEFHFGGVIYKKQKEFINRFYSKVSTSERKNNIYQLLPGWGKTKVLTPYLILDLMINPARINLYQGKTKNKIFVILPEHLVIQSFESISNLLYQYDINTKIIDFNENFTNYSFYNEDMNKDKYFYAENISEIIDSEINVCIFSTYSLQYLLLTSDLDTIKKQTFENIFWIFDEVDFKQYKDSEFNLSGEKVEDIELKVTILHYFLNKLYGEDIPDNVASRYIDLLEKYHPSSKLLPINEKYGIGIRNNEPLVVPYSTVNSPLVNSSFSNIFYNINLNINYYKEKDIHDIDLKNMIKLEKERITSYQNNLFPNYFEIDTNFMIENDVNNIFKVVKDKLLNDDYNQRIKRYFIKKILIDRIYKYSDRVKFSSFFSLLGHNIFKEKDGIAFSGTINFDLPFVYKSEDSSVDGYYLNTGDSLIDDIMIGNDKHIFNQPIKDDLSQGIILSNLYSINQEEIKLLKFNDNDNNLDNIIRKIFSNNIYIIIDVAAQFKDYSTEKIIDKMIEIYKIINEEQTKENQFNSNLEYFFYVDSSKKIKMKQILTGDILDYSSKFSNIVGGLYTQADIVGIDVQLGKTSGVAIFKENTTFTQIVQGIGRLRKLTTIHDIHFMCNELIIKDNNLIDGNSLNHQNLIRFFLNNDTEEKNNNKKYMYKHALFDLIGENEIDLNILEEANFYNYLLKKHPNQNNEVMRYLIEQINEVDSSNSTQQEQSQEQSQEQEQEQEQAQAQSQEQSQEQDSRRNKVMEISNKPIVKVVYKYNIFDIFCTEDFNSFYNNSAFSVVTTSREETSILPSREEIDTSFVLDAMRQLRSQSIFISPMVYLPCYFNVGKIGNISYFILKRKPSARLERESYIVVSLKEYLDLMTVKKQLESNINQEYLKYELGNNKEIFEEKIKQYEIAKNIPVDISMIIKFMNRINMPTTCYYLHQKNSKFLKFFNSYQSDLLPIVRKIIEDFKAEQNDLRIKLDIQNQLIREQAETKIREQAETKIRGQVEEKIKEQAEEKNKNLFESIVPVFNLISDYYKSFMFVINIRNKKSKFKADIKKITGEDIDDNFYDNLTLENIQNSKEIREEINNLLNTVDDGESFSSLDNVNKLKQIINDIAISKQQEAEQMKIMGENNPEQLGYGTNFVIVKNDKYNPNIYVEEKIWPKDIATAFETLLFNHHALEFNHFLTENEINQFITEGGKEIEALLSSDQITELERKIVMNFYNIQTGGSKYSINYKDKYLKYKKKYLKLKKYIM